jgi:hypothetical protein
MSESHKGTDLKRVPFFKGLIVGALTVTVLGVGIGFLHAAQSEEVAAIGSIVEGDKTSTAASNLTLESMPGMEEFQQHKYLQSPEWKAFVATANVNKNFDEDTQREIDGLKGKTFFPDLEVKLEEIESTLNGPYELSPLGFKDSYADVAILKDIQYLCTGHGMSISNGNLLFQHDVSGSIHSLSAVVLQIPESNDDATVLRDALKAGVDTFCPK